ncbi:transporter substrate-binding domain-containing protein [uncultured Paraglaciecola sp.]|uniref:transporter substrate-binding domain-containing protein n=1 Tax=uncultured Paraglaciecola sp. TaxID=1765024 RepID=UPI00260DB10A|nr:transporter substrate-binding domain-containing protein [uncultured Paraglaciecola sp.]
MQNFLGAGFIRNCLLLVSVLSIKCFADSPQLQVVTELSPPYQTLINNEVSGSATTVVKSILSASKVSASFNLYPWARAYHKAITEPNTLIYSIANTAERDELFHWLLPVVEYKFGLVALNTNQTAMKITQLKQVSNFVLAVQRNDIAHKWALNYGLEEGNQLIVCSDIGCSWRLLLNKKVDFIVESPELIESMLMQYDLPITSANYTLAIPELELSGYLAANKNIEPAILEKLRLTIKNGFFTPQ